MESYCPTLELMVAAELGQADRVRHLLTEYANPNYETDEEETAMMKACQHGHLTVVQALLQAPDLRCLNKLSYSTVPNSGTALQLAAEQGHLDIVQELIQAKADVHRQDHHGNTALHRAARNLHVSVVCALLEAGSDVNEKNQEGANALHCAVAFVHNEKLNLEADELPKLELIAGVLVKAGTNLEASKQDEFTVLMDATVRGYSRTVRLLVSLGARINARCRFAATPLHQAVCKGDVEMTNTLLELGANPDIPDLNFGDTPFLTACRFASTIPNVEQVLKALVQGGCNREALDLFQRNAFHVAFSLDTNLPLLESLLSLGVSPASEDRAGNTPLMLALKMANVPVVISLLQMCCDVLVKDWKREVWEPLLSCSDTGTCLQLMSIVLACVHDHSLTAEMVSYLDAVLPHTRRWAFEFAMKFYANMPDNLKAQCRFQMRRWYGLRFPHIVDAWSGLPFLLKGYLKLRELDIYKM